jgi:Platelet-activating factor acetylhydrolase, isoform II
MARNLHAPRLCGRALLLAFITVSITGFPAAYLARGQTGLPGRLQLVFPAPTGEHAVGTVSLHLIDDGRQDLFWSTPHQRELMVSVWYPAVRAVPRPKASWMSSALLSYYRPAMEESLSRTLPGPGICPPGTPAENCPVPPGGENGGDSSSNPVSIATVDFPVTHATRGAPVDLSGRKYPVVLFTPARGDIREQGTALAEDLASHGYIVVTFGSTYEAFGVEFPGGRIELECERNPRPELVDCSSMQQPPPKELKLRRMDAQFVLNQLETLARWGVTPDLDQHALPPGLHASLNLDKIGIFGHSLGGAVATHAMANDRRFDAGLNLDGGIDSILEDFNTQPPPGLSPEEQQAFEESALAAIASLATRLSEGGRPFMNMMTPATAPPVEDPHLIGGGRAFTFHRNLSGFKPFLQVAGTAHGSFTDAMWMYPQLAAAGLIPWMTTPDGRQSVEGAVGTIDSEHAIALNRAYIRAFFDRTLKGIDNHLLDRASAEYPEVTIYY